MSINPTSPTVRVGTPNDDPGQARLLTIPTASTPVPTIAPAAAVPSTGLPVIEVAKLKVTVAIESEKLPTDILPPVGAPGSAKAQVSFKIKAGEHELAVSLKAKTYRDALTKAQACPHGAWVVVQGNLGPDKTLEGAGMTVSPITPKLEQSVQPSTSSAEE